MTSEIIALITYAGLLVTLVLVYFIAQNLDILHKRITKLEKKVKGVGK